MFDLPFSPEQFLALFGDYNEAIWPAQLIAYLVGLLAVALAIWKRPFSDQSISLTLAAYWLWMGGAYHLAFFTRINSAAYLFGLLFVAQGVLFLLAGFARDQLKFRFRKDAYGIAGAIFIGYALIVYAVLGTLAGHTYPEAPVFGVAPCPTVIFTFGMLLWTSGRVPGWLLIIPALWALIGAVAALRLGVHEDVGLFVAGLVGVAMLWHRNRRQKHALVAG
jgi:hypothetical protein